VFSEFVPIDLGVSMRKKEAQQCPICLDASSDTVELDCKHRFCWKCFVLGPIAFQPGEYRISQCPICREETLPTSPTSRPEVIKEEDKIAAPDSQHLLSNLLRTYFPEEVYEGGNETEQEDMREVVGKLVEVVLTNAPWGALAAHTLHTSGGGKSGDAAGRGVDDGGPSDSKAEAAGAGDPGGLLLAPQTSALAGAESCNALPVAALHAPHAQASRAEPVVSDFFQTLPPRSSALTDDQAMRAAQKLQWLQHASMGDPFSLDNKMSCSLCSEPLLMEKTLTTPCKHHFHDVCVRRLEMPQCPLCKSALPFEWFLPAGHPLAETGFRVVPARQYRPVFPGGPSRGTGGYPLHSPPPETLYGAQGIKMRSFLHRIPAGLGGAEAAEIPGYPELSPLSTPAWGPRSRVHSEVPEFPPLTLNAAESASSTDEDSLEDSSSEGVEELSGREKCLAHRSRRSSGHHKPPARYAYSAVGRMRLLGVHDAHSGHTQRQP